MLQSSSKYDFIIIGGGATGSGIALDASLRGFKVLLLEQNDFAEGTSSRSTKLAHGGVRYLEAAIKHLDKEQFALVKEGLKERYRLLKNAPHLAHTISLITPIYKWWEIPYVFAGLKLYDLFAGRYGIGKSSLLSKNRALEINSNMKKDGLKAAIKYYDGAFNDARMTIALLQSAKEKGAMVKNYTQVKEFIYKDDKIIGLKAYDKIESKLKTFYAKYIINATGVFSDNIRKLADKNIEHIIRPSSGIHIVLDKRFLPSKEGLMIPKTKDARVLFILPFMGKCLVGTTDNESKVEVHPKVEDKDIEYLLEHINAYFDMQVKKSDIEASFCGLRPLIDLHPKDGSSKLVREHTIEELSCGLITIAGGKWTTYRSMAEELVDMVVKKMGKTTKCKTIDYKVIGSKNDLKNIKKEIQNIIHNDKLIDRLLSLYGDQAIKILEIANTEGFEYISKKYHILKAELIYTKEYEFVKKPMDFVARRACVSFIDKEEEKRLLKNISKFFKEEI